MPKKIDITIEDAYRALMSRFTVMKTAIRIIADTTTSECRDCIDIQNVARDALVKDMELRVENDPDA